MNIITIISRTAGGFEEARFCGLSYGAKVPLTDILLDYYLAVLFASGEVIVFFVGGRMSPALPLQ